MLRLEEIPEVTFCGLRIFLGTDNADVSNDAFGDAGKIFKDAYTNCVLDKSKITQHVKHNEDKQ